MPNTERRVVQSLQLLNFPHQIFWIPRSTVIRGRIVATLVPAFSRYIFVKFLEAWKIFHHVAEVTGLIRGADGGAAEVRPEVIEKLVGQCGPGNVLPPLAPPMKFRVGDRVIVSGYHVIAGHEGVVKETFEGGRVRLMFDWMGRLVPIDLDERDIEIKRLKRRKRRRSRRGSGRGRVIATHEEARAV